MPDVRRTTCGDGDSQRQLSLAHEKLDVIERLCALKDRAVMLDLKDYERALVWIDGRFSRILPPGLNGSA